MNKLFTWLRCAARALLIFITVTAALGVTYWIIERHSMRDLLAVAMVGLGWLGFGYVIYKRGPSCAREEW